MNQIRVLIVDDHTIVRESLRNLLELQDDIDVVGEAADGSEAVAAISALNPDVVLMDISMPGVDGIEATRQIRKLCPSVKVLALSVHESDEYFFKMLSAGAAGYFVMGGSLVQLVSAIRAVRCGDVFLHPAVAKYLLNDYVRRAQTATAPDADLTRRQREIMKLMADGHTNKDVAATLLLKPTTVQWYRTHIMTTLGLRNNTELTKYALRHGILEFDA